MNQNRNRNDPKVGLTSRKFVMLSFKEIARIAGNSRSLQECSESSYPPISKKEKRNEMLPNPGDRSRRVIASPSIWDLFFLCRRRTCSRTRSIARRRRWRSAATEIAKHRLKWDATETVFFSAVFFFLLAFPGGNAGSVNCGPSSGARSSANRMPSGKAILDRLLPDRESVSFFSSTPNVKSWDAFDILCNFGKSANENCEISWLLRKSRKHNDVPNFAKKCATVT